MKTITYIRVSTETQHRSGLGLEAQREAIAAYAKTANRTAAILRVAVVRYLRSDFPLSANRVDDTIRAAPCTRVRSEHLVSDAEQK